MSGNPTGQDLSSPDALAPRLARYIAAELAVSEDQVGVKDLRRLAGGSSREIWSMDLVVPGEGGSRTLPVVMRRDPPGRSEGDRSLEFRVVRAAHRAGVPVPAVHWCCTDPDVIGTSFYVMDRVEGEALPRRLLRDPEYENTRRVMPGQLARIAARIHQVPLDDPDLAALERPAPGVDAARAEILRIAEGIRTMAAEPHPALDLAERWLLERLPAEARTTLVHGDFRVGNVMFGEEGVRAVLDWELCRIGDPVEDLGWICTRAWRFGNDDLPVGGLTSREALLAAYAEASGFEVTPEHLLFWEALGSYKVALVFVQQSWVYRSGLVRSLELASLGRRIVEAEQELVRLMEASS